MPGVVADTHALVWYLCSSSSLSTAARERFRASREQGHPILVPSVCLVEMIYLVEKGRLARQAWHTLLEHLDDPCSELEVATLDRGIADAVQRVPRDQVPDMPDRIIAATAVHFRLPLVTRDARLRAAPIETIW
jgi:PIN domain nuclease of toxin-antitoxin system